MYSPVAIRLDPPNTNGQVCAVCGSPHCRWYCNNPKRSTVFAVYREMLTRQPYHLGQTLLASEAHVDHRKFPAFLEIRTPPIRAEAEAREGCFGCEAIIESVEVENTEPIRLSDGYVWESQIDRPSRKLFRYTCGMTVACEPTGFVYFQDHLHQPCRTQPLKKITELLTHWQQDAGVHLSVSGLPKGEVPNSCPACGVGIHSRWYTPHNHQNNVRFWCGHRIDIDNGISLGPIRQGGWSKWLQSAGGCPSPKATIYENAPDNINFHTLVSILPFELVDSPPQRCPRCAATGELLPQTSIIKLRCIRYECGVEFERIDTAQKLGDISGDRRWRVVWEWCSAEEITNNS